MAEVHKGLAKHRLNNSEAASSAAREPPAQETPRDLAMLGQFVELVLVPI